MSKPIINAIERRIRRCPRCRSASIVIREFWYTFIDFHQCDDGEIRRVFGAPDHEPTGRAEGRCSACGNRWAIRRRFEGTTTNKTCDESGCSFENDEGARRRAIVSP
jgi:ribosomal protein S14